MYQNIYFLFQNTQKNPKETKEKRKPKRTKEEKGKENVVVDSICRESNGNYRSANEGRARAKNNKLRKAFVDICLLYIHD